MKAKKLMMAGVIAISAIALINCKKNPNGLPELQNDKVTTEQSEGNLRQIPQANYNVSVKEVIKTIKQFKSIEQSNPNVQSRLILADSLEIDSAIWVLEAAINYDFDTEMDANYESEYIDTQFFCPMSAGTKNINSNDLETVYSNLTSYLTGITNDTLKIKFVNVEGFEYDPSTGTAVFKAQVAKVNKAKAYQCPTSLLNGWAPTFLIAPTVGWQIYFGCSWNSSSVGGTLPFAPSNINNVIDCEPYSYEPCMGSSGYFWYNINTNLFTTGPGGPSTNPYQGALYCSSSNPAALYCSFPQMNLMSLSTANSHLANLKILAHTNGPAGKSYISSSVWGFIKVDAQTSGNYYLKWEMQSNWGIRQCREIMQ